MTLPKCPCGGEPERHYNGFNLQHTRRCPDCGMATSWNFYSADADRAWCRTVAAEAMEKALEFYADRARYGHTHDEERVGEDCGDRARAALKAARVEDP